MTNDLGKLTVYIENDNQKEKYINNLNIGELVFFHKQSLEDNIPLATNKYPGHVGIYIGNNNFIHASPDVEKIIISPFDEYWLKILVASRDIIPEIIKLCK